MATSNPAIRYQGSSLVRQARQRAFVHGVDLPQLGHFIPIADFQFPIANWLNGQLSIDNRQLAIGNVEAHPLPRGGTDLMTLDCR